MKLAEALILRADCQKKIAQLRQRLSRSVRVQEGEQPPENPQSLLSELEGAIAELTTLIQRINKTNSSTALNGGTLSDALAQRDTLGIKRSAIDGVIQNAAIVTNRYSQSEVKFVSTVDIAALQRQLDGISQELRYYHVLIC
ncbi:MAG: DIP1984 family protein [Phormidesmis sp. RL_2_1]|nr:DIP1984 family protein [Phormidesmis sp. RL_2_1]